MIILNWVVGQNDWLSVMFYNKLWSVHFNSFDHTITFKSARRSVVEVRVLYPVGCLMFSHRTKRKQSVWDFFLKRKHVLASIQDLPNPFRSCISDRGVLYGVIYLYAVINRNTLTVQIIYPQFRTPSWGMEQQATKATELPYLSHTYWSPSLYRLYMGTNNHWVLHGWHH